MLEWLIAAFCLLTIILGGTYLYYLAHLMLTITKCPDCGRIMQKVLYTEWEDSEERQIVYECRFCQAKRIRPLYRGKRFTMYP
ncbi:hypothetical protein [Effusibacillus consociatus]|uniref:Uncharacterized protein n=1 Tax=Effusibacillus consociatus TaxID=1117041 RepID=A0ABV9Q489_9BACL